MHRLASIHLHSYSHYCSRLSVTIATAPSQAPLYCTCQVSERRRKHSAQTSRFAFTKEQVCSQKFLRDFAAACRKMSFSCFGTGRLFSMEYICQKSLITPKLEIEQEP